MPPLERRISDLEKHSRSRNRPANEWSTSELEAYASELLGIDRPPTDDELLQLIESTEGTA